MAAAIAQQCFALRVPIDLNPDAAWVAYTLVRTERRERDDDPRFKHYSRSGVPVEALGCEIWISELATGRSRNLTDGQGSARGPSWSPVGDKLAFYWDRDGLAQLWIWDRSSERLHRADEAVVRPFFGFEVMAGSNAPMACC